MKKLLLIITLILPLLLSSESWGSSLPECEGSPLVRDDLFVIKFRWDNCQGTVSLGDQIRQLSMTEIFKDGKFAGLETLDGKKYVGEWKDGLRNGQGISTSQFINYVGEWKDGKYHGQGTLKIIGLYGYVGEWKDNKKHGQGTYIYSNGEQYVGEYKDDKKHGQGTYTYSNDEQYVGEWKDGKYHGQGTRRYKFLNYINRKQQGIWKDGKFLHENIVTSKDDKNFCLEIGFKRSTPEFDNCVEKTAEKD